MTSSVATTFSLFPDLPKELRLQIWVFAVEPRVLRLRCSIQPLDFYNMTPFIYLIGGYGFPHRHFTLNEPERPHEPYYTVHLEPHEYSPPPLLSACRESRDIVFENGYKTWLISSDPVIWNPSLGFILLEEDYRVDNPLEVFLQLFPEQAREVRRLAAWSSMWKRSAHADVEKLLPLMEMDLDEFVVIADEEYERMQIEALRTEWRRAMQVAWKIPESLRVCFIKARVRYLRNHSGANVGNPAMRVVQNPEELLEGEDLNLALRVWPCESLGFGSVENEDSALDDIIVRINGWKLRIRAQTPAVA